MHTLSALKGKDSVLFGGVQISLHRTLRVPDQVGKKSALPPVRPQSPLSLLGIYAPLELGYIPSCTSSQIRTAWQDYPFHEDSWGVYDGKCIYILSYPLLNTSRQ